MNKRLSVKADLRVDELAQRYRGARDGVERGQWQVIWLLAQGRTCQEVAGVTGYSVPWVRALVHRYNALGAAGMGDRRRQRRGTVYLLTAEQQAALAQALEGAGPDGGLWSGPQVATWMSAQLGRRVGPQTGWVYLRRLGFTPHRPRPRHVKADADAQAALTKGRWKQP
jgi:transposase